MDQEKMDFLNEDYYIDYYENAIARDVKLLAENSGYVVTDALVELNEEYEVEEMELRVARQERDAVIVGTLQEEENEEIAALREKIAAYYQVPADKISILY